MKFGVRRNYPAIVQCKLNSIKQNYLILHSSMQVIFKDIDSTVAKRGSVFIEIMTPDGAIWSRN